ncbi:MAG: hypothetical protein SAJ12_22975 [Jaaginema sp. PMC 1079.18]|nr:hypothetical protein [Jaaginema sp. PMC 1080.18]MEC4853854.1 hypothetical protein [Jaaginema sp. PMC 1079.18]MEC4868715.1 hypothetical protein [Jaaginema sp. PMC 1078.18]
MFELIHPVNRLLDFWCGHPDQSQPFTPVSEWTENDWQAATIYLHPQLQTNAVKEALKQCCSQLRAFPISQFLPIAGRPDSSLDATAAANILLPLLKSPCSLATLVEQWLRFQPFSLETLEPNNPEAVSLRLQNLLTGLEKLGYILLEQ